MNSELEFDERLAYEEYLEEHEESGKKTKPLTEKQFFKKLRAKKAKKYGSVREVSRESEGVMDSLSDLLGDLWNE